MPKDKEKTIDEIKKEIKDLESSFSSIKEKFEITKADMDKMPEKHDDKMKEMMHSVYSMVDYLHRRIDASNSLIGAAMDKQWEHANTSHLPPLPAKAMKKLLKACDMDEEYQVAKKNLYCSASINKHDFEIEIKQKEKQ